MVIILCYVILYTHSQYTFFEIIILFIEIHPYTTKRILQTTPDKTPPSSRPPLGALPQRGTSELKERRSADRHPPLRPSFQCLEAGGGGRIHPPRPLPLKGRFVRGGAVGERPAAVPSSAPGGLCWGGGASLPQRGAGRGGPGNGGDRR